MKAKNILGNKIQKLRKNQGHTQEKLAEILGISRAHMGHIEQGIKRPSLKLLEKIAKALKVKVGDVFS